MRRGLLVCGIGLLTVISASAESAGKWNTPKTPWGHPDLQGIWTSDDLHDVPMERPAQFGARRFLTEDELKKRANDVDNLLGVINDGKRRRDAGFFSKVTEGVEGAAVPQQWTEFARRASNLTSLVADPPNGRIPALTEEGKQRRAAQPSYTNMQPASWEDSTMYDRCISRGITGSYFPSIYGNGSQIIQTQEAVAIRYEMIHETRIIPVAQNANDSRLRHPGSNFRTYMGDPRGHWEGNTLVVETSNFIGGKLSVGGTPYSEDLKLVERFTRTSENTLEYEVTVNDPKTFTAPWTVAFPVTREPGYQIFEYACHEGNYAMRNRLSAARALDKEDAEAAAKKK